MSPAREQDVVEPWSVEEATKHRRSAQQVYWGDEFHRSGRCLRGGPEVRMSCGTCAVSGYEPRGGWSEDYSVRRDGPNYAGWARIYVEAGIPIPKKFVPAFLRELDRTDNLAYVNALRRSIATFKVRFDG